MEVYENGQLYCSCTGDDEASSKKCSDCTMKAQEKFTACVQSSSNSGSGSGSSDDGGCSIASHGNSHGRLWLLAFGLVFGIVFLRRRR